MQLKIILKKTNYICVSLYKKETKNKENATREN